MEVILVRKLVLLRVSANEAAFRSYGAGDSILVLLDLGEQFVCGVWRVGKVGESYKW